MPKCCIYAKGRPKWPPFHVYGCLMHYEECVTVIIAASSSVEDACV